MALKQADVEVEGGGGGRRVGKTVTQSVFAALQGFSFYLWDNTASFWGRTNKDSKSAMRVWGENDEGGECGEQDGISGFYREKAIFTPSSRITTSELVAAGVNKWAAQRGKSYN